MIFDGAGRGRRRGLVALAVVFAVWVTGSQGIRAQAPARPAEVRALWVLRSSLTTPAGIESLVRTAREQGFNTLLVQVRGRGDAYYTSTIEPRPADLMRQPSSFDPLAAVIGAAHAAGLRVHAWMNLDLIASAADLPTSRDHLIYQHPEWLMVPREIAQDVAKIEATNPGYVGKLARWSRANATVIEGLYASPVVPAAADYTVGVVADVARRYEVDGIHLDYARYPNDQFDYSRFSIAEFKTAMRTHLTAPQRVAADEQDAIDLFAYPDRFPAEWKAFRRERLTTLVSRIHRVVREVRPAALLTSAVAPDPVEAANLRLQDWKGWLESGLVDAVCPMAYTQEPARFAEQIAAARAAVHGAAIWAGIGAYRLSPAQTIANIQAARRLGAAGFVLFSYDSLTGPAPPAPDYLATVSRGFVEHGSGS